MLDWSQCPVVERVPGKERRCWRRGVVAHTVEMAFERGWRLYMTAIYYRGVAPSSERFVKPTTTSWASMQYGLLPLVARLLVTLEFLIAVNGKLFGWSSQAAYMAAEGMPFVTPLLAAAFAIEAIGSLLLIIGYRARPAAAVMFIYLGIVSVRLHAFNCLASRSRTHARSAPRPEGKTRTSHLERPR